MMFKLYFSRLLLAISVLAALVGSVQAIAAKENPSVIMSPTNTIIYKQVTLGDNHTCALTVTGAVRCWGKTYGPYPVDITGLNNGVTDIKAGGDRTCALLNNGDVKCWGVGYGSSPMTIIGLNNASKLSVNTSGYGPRGCALTATSSVICWGFNNSGVVSISPISGFSSDLIAIDIWENRICVLTGSGTIQCINNNLPNATVNTEFSSGVSAFSGAFAVCGIINNSVLCSGFDLIIGTYNSTPTQVNSLTNGVTTLSVSSSVACVTITGGAVKCWGKNQVGQLGDGSTTSTNVPVIVNGLNNGVTAIGTGISHNCAVTSTGGIKCWGYNQYGQLGNGNIGSLSNSNTAVDVIERLTVTSPIIYTKIIVGNNYACALTTIGTVRCWGDNYGPYPLEVTRLHSE